LYEFGETLYCFYIAILRNEKGEFLLLRRSENSPQHPGKWDLPRGKLTRGETLEEAVVCEVWGETGISIIPGEIARYTIFELPEKKVIAAIYDGGYIIADVKLSDEHIEYAWSPFKNYEELTNFPEHFKEFFERFAAENKKPPKIPV
jgi:8-oxo-dGTP diphosphatase